MGIAENKQVVTALYEANNRGDLEGFLGLVADDVKWTNVGSGRYSGTWAGKDNVMTNLFGPLFGQLKAGIRATVDNVIAEGDCVAVQLRGEAETKGGTPYNNTYCHIFRFRDGLICEVTEYFDTELAAKVLAP